MSDAPLTGPVLVTGATGFVGTHLCHRLRSAGIEVRGAVRRADAALADGVERVVIPSLDDTDALARAMAGTRSVVHLAARVHVMHETFADPLAEFRKVNVTGTANVLAAAEAAGVARLVFVSSVKVNGEGKPTPYTETDPPDPTDFYGISKLEAEQLITASSGRMQCSIIRPPLVYGPGVGGNFLRLVALSRAAARVPLPLGGIENRRSLVFVRNLADAIVHLLLRDGGGGQAFLVSDGDDLSTPELLRRIGNATGRRVVLFPFPGAILRLGARLVGRGSEADRMLGSLTVDISRLRAMGWSPPFTVDDGLREMM